jgi:hypothetical protein
VDVAVVHALVLPLALLALLCLPCFVALVICADDLIDRVAWNIADRREARRERRLLDKLEQALPDLPEPVVPPLPAGSRPSIQEIAADLRRLGRQRLGVAATSSVWHAAILRAYDERLRLACGCLEIPEHLGELDGIDLEIERVRVEGELAGAGLVLNTVRRRGGTAA